MRLKHGFECHTGYSGSTARPDGGSQMVEAAMVPLWKALLYIACHSRFTYCSLHSRVGSQEMQTWECHLCQLGDQLLHDSLDLSSASNHNAILQFHIAMLYCNAIIIAMSYCNAILVTYPICRAIASVRQRRQLLPLIFPD